LSVFGNQFSVVGKKSEMKKLILLLALLFFAFVNANAQTKKIALASHSGKKSEFKIDGDGNFGWYPNPIEEANMRHYSDSLRKTDSIKHIAIRNDSIRKADSVRRINHPPLPKKTYPKKRAKGLHAAADFGKPNRSAVISYR
jgi:hypothetical protein